MGGELALEPLPPLLCVVNRPWAGLIRGPHWGPEAAPCTWLSRILGAPLGTQTLMSAQCVQLSGPSELLGGSMM